MSPNWEYPEGATPLSPDEVEGIIPRYIGTQRELNAAEQMNIAKGLLWAEKRKPSVNDLLSRDFLCDLHRHLLGDVWRWAGQFRKTEKNIGVDPIRIPTELKKLLDDVQYQVDHGVDSIDQIAVRLHHRMVCIHPFPNGNGRHARIITDCFLRALDAHPFLWGALMFAPMPSKQRLESGILFRLERLIKGT